MGTFTTSSSQAVSKLSFRFIFNTLFLGMSVLMLSAGLLNPAPAAAQCSGTATYSAYGSKEYMYCTGTTTWSAADTNCQLITGSDSNPWRLARIDDSSENTHIDGMIGGTTWIGGDDSNVEGEWRWTDDVQFWQGGSGGSSVGGLYENWASGEPSTSNSNRDCAYINTDSQWYARSCTGNRRFVCEGAPVCGNGAVGATEECDDGNTTDGDGCDSSCKAEFGFTCTGEPSSCTGGCVNQITSGYGSSEYIYCPTTQNFSAAQAACQALGTGWNLALVDNVNENSLLYNLYLQNPTNSSVWLGMTDQAGVFSSTGEGDWRFHDGTLVFSASYQNWGSGEPNDNGGQDCGSYWNGTPYQWDDIACTANLPSLCEGPASCGDGIRAPSVEECDDGNTADGDGCSSTCTVETPPVCGDSVIEGVEECDDGNTSNSDGCSSTCTIESGWSCVAEPSVCSFLCTGGTWHSNIAGGVVDTEYFYCPVAANWGNALGACGSLGDDWSLVTINNSTENTYVDGLSASAFWIGFFDTNTEGTFVWANGTSSEIDWASGQPDNAGNSDCARMQSGAVGTWTDEVCTNTAQYLCEGPPLCGNGVIGYPSEQCDDGNQTPGDGCDASCAVEAGYECTAANPSVCSIATHAVVDAIELGWQDRQLYLQWRSISEEGSLGYWPMVLNQRSGEWELLSDELIPSSLLDMTNTMYRVKVPQAFARSSQHFRVYELDITGAQLLVAESQLNGANAPEAWSFNEQALSRPEHSPAPAAFVHQALRNNETPLAVFATLERGGIFSLNLSDIAASFALQDSELRARLGQGQLSIASERGEVSWRFDAETNVVLGYVKDTQSIYSTKTILRLTLADGQELSVQETQSGASQGLIQGRQTIVLEQNKFAATAVSPDPETDYWFWQAMSANLSGYKSFQTNVVLPQAPLGQEVVVGIDLFGAWAIDSELSQDVELWINGVKSGTLSLSRLGAQHYDLAVPSTRLKRGSNQLRLVAKASSTLSGGFYLDKISLRYSSLLDALASSAEFEAEDSGVFSVQIEGEGAIAIDLSDGVLLQVDERPISDELSQITAEFVAGHRYALSSVEGLLESSKWESLSKKVMSNLAKDVDYLILTNRSMYSAAQRLAAYRNADGLRSAVVLVEDVYLAYGFALPKPQAIKELLSYLQPKYVLLLGDGSYDYRFFGGQGPGAIAPKMIQTRFGLYASDVWFADITGNDLVPDLSIGRLPATNLEAAERMVARIIAWESTRNEAFSYDATLLTGSNRIGDFSKDSAKLEGLVGDSLATKSIDVNALGLEDARVDFFTALSEGTLWVNYFGHGGMDRFDGVGLLLRDDVSTLSNSRLPIVTAMTCAVGRYESPNATSLAEALVSAEQGGAIAVWAPTGLSMSASATDLAMSFANSFWSSSSDAQRLGTIFSQLHIGAQSDELAKEMLPLYTLFGDPALNLPVRESLSIAGASDTTAEASNADASSQNSGQAKDSGLFGLLSQGSCSVSSSSSQGWTWLSLIVLVLFRRRKR
ncbi:MAG: DUF4215 domain-containing protein [Myxococcales bacterium]|nr:MAG: DUF4215 domain-containing protein [Myxococcales bacterium]